MVVNTLGWVEALGYELLLHAIKSLKVGEGKTEGRRGKGDG